MPLNFRKVEAHPAHYASYIWRGPQGQEIDSDRNRRYEKIVDGENVKLVIHNPTLADMGPYPVEVVTANDKIASTLFQVRVDIPCNDKINASCQAKSESITTNTSLVIRQKAKVKVFSNKPEEEKFFQKQQALLSEHGYNISCSAEGFEINRTSASLYFRPCISYNACQVICETE